MFSIIRIRLNFNILRLSQEVGKSLHSSTITNCAEAVFVEDTSAGNGKIRNQILFHFQH